MMTFIVPYTSKAVRLVTILVKLLDSSHNNIHSVTGKDAIRHVLLKAKLILTHCFTNNSNKPN